MGEQEAFLFELLDFEVFPGGGEGALLFADAVDLEAEVAFGVGFEDFFVGEIGDCFSVDPSFDVSFVGDDAEVVPLSVLHEGVRDELIIGREPAATGRFAVDVTGLGSFVSAGFDLTLRSEDAATVGVFVDVLEEGAEHHSGVEGVVDLDLEFEFEVVVLGIGGEEAVRASFFGGADDGVAFDGVFRFATFDGPTVEVFAVEEGGPAGAEFLDRDVAIPDFIAVVLEEEAAGGVGGKVGMAFELGLGVGGLPWVAADGDVDDKLPVEVVLQVSTYGDNAGGVPFADGLDGAFVGVGKEIVKSARAVGGLGPIGVLGIDYLIFESEVLVAVLSDAVFHAAVALFGNFPIPAEFEVAVFLGGVEIARLAGAVENAAFGNPAAFFDGRASAVGPTIEGFAVEEIGEAVLGAAG